MAKSIYMRRHSEDEDGDDVWTLQKFNTDLDPQGSYQIRESQMGELICTCPARTAECRHVRMMEMFTNAEAGTDDLYNLCAAENPDHIVMLQTDAKRFDWVPGFDKASVEAASEDG